MMSLSAVPTIRSGRLLPLIVRANETIAMAPPLPPELVRFEFDDKLVIDDMSGREEHRGE